MEKMEWESFSTRLGNFILGDSRVVLKKLPDEVADVIITDPPWGVGFDKYDNFNTFLDVRDELFRVLKSNSWLVFFFTPKRIYDLVPYLQKFMYRWMIPYVLTGTHSRNPLGSQMSYSIIMVFSKGEPKIFSKRKDVIYAEELPIVEGNIKEPQFKPTFTVSAILNMFSKVGDLVLDPFAGYGSIPLVCELFDRKWLSIEIDEVKYKIAKKIITDKKVSDISKLKEMIIKSIEQTTMDLLISEEKVK
jgi:site-specific DNA-methyltransferase (adenine-specific)